MTVRTAAPTSLAALSAARRWTMLGVSTAAQAGSAVMIHGPAFLIPALHRDHGLSLVQAGLVAAAPIAGVMVALVAWGAVVDRLGERFVLLAGLTATAGAGLIATQTTEPVALGLALLLAGAAAASTASASGRVVVGWFPPRQRGLAMGIRHMSQPAGVGIAAVTMAVLALEHSIAAALWVPTAAAAISIAGVALTVVDPPRPERTVVTGANPYRAEPRLGYLARIHVVSVLLVVPQFLVWTFAVVWLVDERGWHPGAAGVLVGTAQLTGVLARVVAGWASDRVGNRMRPLRAVAVMAGVVMALLALTDALDSGLGVGPRGQPHASATRRRRHGRCGHGAARADRCTRLRAGRPPARRRHRSHRRGQRTGFHRRRRASRTVLVRAGAGGAEHCAVPRRSRRTPGRRPGDHPRRVRRDLRHRRGAPSAGVSARPHHR
ncbi:MFS family permease [Nocardioides massiliensis]|uniref:MFS family permease n=2 Tax=Nocardioides massiliensis TaxID=1325935 RepID=A0ABT9NMS1_9ACTN|nr:MFS family permease [Nocardioides massiliensis]